MIASINKDMIMYKTKKAGVGLRFFVVVNDSRVTVSRVVFTPRWG